MENENENVVTDETTTTETTSTDNNESSTTGESSNSEVMPEFDEAGINESLGSVNATAVNGKVKGVMAKMGKKLAGLKFKAFLKEKGLDPEKFKSEKDLEGTEYASEYESYKMPQAEAKEPFEAAKNEIIQITDERNEKINEMIGDQNGKQGKLQQLAEEARKTLETLDEEKDKDKIDRLNSIIEKIEGKDGQGGMIGDWMEQSKKQMSIRRRAMEDLTLTMDTMVVGGAAMVTRDNDLYNSLGRLNDEGKLVTKLEDEAKGIKYQDGEVVEEPQKEENEQVAPGENQQATVQTQQQPAAQAQQAQAQTAQTQTAPEQTEEPEQEVAEDNNSSTAKMLGLLGYELNDGIISPNQAMNMLRRFTTEFIDDKTKFAMINDPTVKAKLQQAVKVANKKKWFNRKYRKQYKYIRKEFAEIVDEVLPREALNACGLDEANSVLADARNTKITLEQQLNDPNLTEEQKAEIQAKVKAIDNVLDFRSQTANAKLIRHRVKDVIRYAKDSVIHPAPALPKAKDEEVKEQNEEVAKDEKTVENKEKEIETETPSWKSMTKDENEIANHDVKREEQVKDEKTPEQVKEEQAKNEQDIGGIE